MDEGPDLGACVEKLLCTAVSSVSRQGGGDLSAVHIIRLGNGEQVIAKQTPQAEAEAAMLQAIAEAGAPAPEVLAVEANLLLMNRCEGRSGPGASWDSLAEVLNRLWSASGTRYGWPDDYGFGFVELPNSWQESWSDFWSERRLLCHLEQLPSDLAGRIEGFARSISDHLPAKPSPSLLHGDLWGGNIMASGGEVTGLIDPACYYGHREVDLAMLGLFDHPPRRFVDALELEPGWEERQPVYRLFPLIVHLRLFGEGYRTPLEADLRRLGC